MKSLEFNQERKVKVSNDQGVFEFNSYADTLGFFDDVKNTEQWAVVHETSVFIAHRFDTDGKIADSFDTNKEAELYAEQLNEYFAICEEYNLEEL